MNADEIPSPIFLSLSAVIREIRGKSFRRLGFIRDKFVGFVGKIRVGSCLRHLRSLRETMLIPRNEDGI